MACFMTLILSQQFVVHNDMHLIFVHFFFFPLCEFPYFSDLLITHKNDCVNLCCSC